jgi:hypothetical protein
MTQLTRLACGLLLAVAASTAALAAPNDDLTGLSDGQYVEYARVRFAWLTDEIRVNHRLSGKFHRECQKDAQPNSDAARACEVAKATDQERAQMLQEGRDLMRGLQQRLGAVPRWARNADVELEKTAQTH